VAEFPVNPTRFDPYKAFKFRVKWDGRTVAGIDHVSGLIRTTEVVAHREGGDPSLDRVSPGRTRYEAITLARGLTQDAAFEDWANKVSQLGAAAGSEVALADFRKDIVIDLLNEAGQRVLSWKVFRCWPSEYVALGPLDAENSAVALESLTLENEGWERDTTVVEPVEPA
jgi:phage tail-like protein